MKQKPMLMYCTICQKKHFKEYMIRDYICCWCWGCLRK